MDAKLLGELRAMADLTIEVYAERIGVSTEELREMEAGRKEIPARFDRDAYRVTNRVLWTMMGYDAEAN